MNRLKKLVLPLVIASVFSLSSCTIFNDDDIEIHNSFNPKISEPSSNPDAIVAGGVEGKPVDEVSNALCFKNICYATNESIANTYKTGGVNENEYNINNGEDYPGTTRNNNYDLYVPNSLNKNDKHVVILFIHGGAWVSGFKTDVNEYVHEFANRGYITATIKYSLLKRTMDDETLSIFRDLDEIDACISSIKSVLGQLGFDTTKSNLVIGGASSGAHLAMLYSYSRGSRSALPIKFIVDAVGPVDIKADGWKRFSSASDEVLDAGITYSAIETQRAASNLSNLDIMGEEPPCKWNDYQTVRISNGMCGIPYTLAEVEACSDENKTDIITYNEVATSMTKPGGGQDLLSVTYYMSATNKIPMICAYAGRDRVVGIAQYARLENAMNTYGIDHEFIYFKNCDHTEITEEKTPQRIIVSLIKSQSGVLTSKEIQ